MIKLERTTAYTVDEASEKLMLNRQTILSYIKAGKLRAQRVGRRYYVTEQTIDEFINGDVMKDENKDDANDRG